jgi:Fungal specific transcription factor domain
MDNAFPPYPEPHPMHWPSLNIPAAQPAALATEDQPPVPSRSGNATPAARGGLSLGAQAFRESLWLFAPSQNHHVKANQSDLSLPIDDLVQKTECRASPPPCAPLSQQTRDQILATVLTQCDSAMAPRVAASFPSAELLTNLIHKSIIQHYEGTDKYIHLPTFDPNQQLLVLIMSLITAGAYHSEFQKIRRLSSAFLETARATLAQLFESDNTTVRSLKPLQAYVLQLDVGLWGGDRRQMEIAESFSLSLITMLKRGGRFRQPVTSMDPPCADDSPETTDAKWSQWIEEESFKRIVYHLLVRDAQVSSCLINSPVISPSEIMIQLPLCTELWQARTSSEWKSIYLAKIAGMEASVPSLRACLDDISSLTDILHMIDFPFASLVILSAHWTLGHQYRELVRFHGPDLRRNLSLILTSMYEEITQGFTRVQMSLTEWPGGMQALASVMYERIQMNMHVFLEDVQTLAGKAGEEEARKIFPILSAWAQSRESRRAIWHAGQLFRALKEYAPKTLQDFSAVALYHVSLVLWAYSIVSTTTYNTSRPGTSTAQTANTRSNNFNQPIVILDGEDNSQVQHFLTLARGVPAVTGYSQNGHGRTVLLSDAKTVMSSIVGLLRAKTSVKDEECTPLVTNLSKLMKSLGHAASGIRVAPNKPSEGDMR